MAQAASRRAINLRNKFIARTDKWNVFKKGKRGFANRRNGDFFTEMRNHILNSNQKISTRAFYAILFAAAFGLNWVWEVAQMFAYQTELNKGWVKALLACTGASVIDAIVTVAIYGLLARLIKPNQAMFYLGAAILGALCAVGFEWFAVYFNLWSYSEQMIVLPIINVGLLPFVQLTLLVPSAIWLTKKFNNFGINSLSETKMENK